MQEGAGKGVVPAKAQAIAGNPDLEVGRSTGRKIRKPIGCGVIGLGRIGWSHHCRIIQAHDSFALAAVVDVNQERVAEARAASGCAGYARIDELLADPRVELVLVCTQTRDHEPMTLRALKAGKHVLVEKPAALNAAGFARMVAAARRARRLLTVHHNHEISATTFFVGEVLASGKLGKLFRIRRHQGGFSRRDDWQTLRKYGGGMVGNWGVHLVSEGLHFMKPPLRFVWGTTRRVVNPGDAEDDVKAVVQDRDGVVLDIDMTSADASVQPSWVLLGSTGTLWIQGKTAFLKYFDPRQLKPLSPIDAPHATGRKYGVSMGDSIPWVQEELPVAPVKTYDSFYDNLFKAIRKGARPYVTTASAMLVYKVLDAIRAGKRF